MIKPFEILKEEPAEGGILIVYKVSKSVMVDLKTLSRTTVTSTIFVGEGLNTEDELVIHLRAGGWL